MGSRLCLVLVIFFFAATLIVSVYLRDSNHRVFYTLRRYKIEQGRLQQDLWQKQLRVESLINPASISHHAGEYDGTHTPRSR
jgi:cytochrome c-type biogenesis protein CcmE